MGTCERKEGGRSSVQSAITAYPRSDASSATFAPVDTGSTTAIEPIGFILWACDIPLATSQPKMALEKVEGRGGAGADASKGKM